MAFAIFLFSLTGLPPFAGFVGKWYLFYAVVERIPGPGGGWYAVLALIGALNTRGLALLLRADRPGDVLRPAVRRGPARPEPRVGYQLLLGAFSVAVLVFGIWWTPMIDWTGASLQMFRG